MKPGVVTIFCLLFIGCGMYSNIEFLGEIKSANTDGNIIVENDEKVVKVMVIFRVISSEVRLTSDEILIVYYINITNPDSETIDINRDSLLKWTFHTGNIFKVRATRKNGVLMEQVFSEQDLGIVQWANDLGSTPPKFPNDN